MKKKLLFVICATSLFFIAFLLRVSDLHILPKGLNWDEAAYAYNAYSIWKTGKDEWGLSAPFFIKSFGEYKPALLSYLMIPFLTLTTNWVIGARIVVVLINSLAVVAWFSTMSRLTKNTVFGYLFAFLLCITPWHIHFSRIAIDPGIAFGLMSIGFALLLHTRTLLKGIGILFLLLSMYAYNAERGFIPLFMLGATLFFYQGSHLKKFVKNHLSLCVLFLSISLLLGALTIFGKTGDRLRTASFLFSQDESSRVLATQQLAHSLGLPSLQPFDQPYLGLLMKISTMYSLYFRPDFLFFPNGNINASPIFGYPGHGNILTILAPFFIIGIIGGAKKLSKSTTERQSYILPLIWLILSPLPGAITSDSPHPGRSLIMLPSILYFITLGIYIVVESFKTKMRQRAASLIIMTLICINFTIFYRDLLVHFPEQSESYFQGYFEEVGKWIQQKSPQDRVLITHALDTHTLLFLAMYSYADPGLIQQGSHQIGGPDYISSYGNVSLLNSQQQKLCELLHNNTILIITPDESMLLQSEAKIFYRYSRFGITDAILKAYHSDALHMEDREKLQTICTVE